MPATKGQCQEHDETGAKLGPLSAPEGGRAYRVTWHGAYHGYVEATVDRAGNLNMRTSGAGDASVTAPLQPGDLDFFESELAQSPFARTADHPHDTNCLDNCAYYFLTVATGAGRKTVPVDEFDRSSTTIGDAANDLIELALARTGDFEGRPGPWWIRDHQPHPTPAIWGARAWRDQLNQLGLADLWTSSRNQGDDFYRLVWVAPQGRAHAISLTRTFGACDIWVGPTIPDLYLDHVWVSESGRRRARRIGSDAMNRFEVELFRARFATLPAEAPAPCPGGDAWVLEADHGGRYRYLAGSSCDMRGLAAPIMILRRWAGEHP